MANYLERIGAFWTVIKSVFLSHEHYTMRTLELNKASECGLNRQIAIYIHS